MTNSKKDPKQFMKEIGAHAFTHISKSGAKKTYYKGEHELTDDEHEILYQNFARHWDSLPLKAKNRFMKWLREALQEKADKANKNLS